MKYSDEFMYAIKFVYHLAVAFALTAIGFATLSSADNYTLGDDTCRRLDGVHLNHQEYSSYFAVVCMLPDSTTVLIRANK